MLIQWILQNLSNLFIIGSGGSVCGGSATSSLVINTNPYSKKTNYIIGDLVYDKCSKPWIVIGFEFSPSGEPKFTLTNNITKKVLYQSQLLPAPDYEFCNSNLKNKVIQNINKLTNTPLNNYPVYSGSREIEQ